MHPAVENPSNIPTIAQIISFTRSRFYTLNKLQLPTASNKNWKLSEDIAQIISLRLYPAIENTQINQL